MVPDENEDPYIDKQRVIIYEFYKRLKKKLQIDSLRQFLKRCHGITEVVVLGHSMGSVDSEYMELIESAICPNIWMVSCHGGGDSLLMNLNTYSFAEKCILFSF